MVLMAKKIIYNVTA